MRMKRYKSERCFWMKSSRELEHSSQFVHPEHGVIDYFIENLTGIKNGQVKHAPRLQEALLHMLNWIGDREYKVYAWSGSDRAQILHEIKAKNIVDEKIASFMEESRWVDYQDIFMMRYEMSRKMSLEEALGRADIDSRKEDSTMD